MSGHDDPAYPTVCVSQDNSTGATTSWQAYGGLTKRELMAAKAMQGLLANGSLVNVTVTSSIDHDKVHSTEHIRSNPRSPEWIAAHAVSMADALIAELGK